MKLRNLSIIPIYNPSQSISEDGASDPDDGAAVLIASG
jgi:hypothetical protein